ANAAVLERLAEVALLISLFAVGLRLGVPLRDRRWRLPLRLAFVSMAAMVAMVTAIGVWVLHLPLGAAVLLGAILAPTDPVLASDVKSEPGSQPDRLGFSLAAEGGLNDGAAFPFVMLGLGLLGSRELGPGLARWWSIDLVWASLGGVAIGAALGAATGRLVVYLRSRHGEAVGLDEFLGLGLVGMAYGIAQLSLASGFLAVFAAGLALQRVREQPQPHTRPLAAAAGSQGHSYDKLATHSHHASVTMRDSVQGFNGQLEKLAELTLVLLVGAMLAYARPLPAVWWFVPLMLLVLRPISVVASTWGEQLTVPQHAMVGWFGIRGIGSVFYLLLVLREGLEGGIADTLVSLTLWTVAASIVVHGITAQPLMQSYVALRKRVRAKHGQGSRK
ncbi:MAG: cation:proton antiporter, partial [Rubrivivax sp.]